MTKMNLSERLAAAAQHSKQQLAAAPVQAPETWPARKVKPPKPARVQFLVRLTEPAREAIREAAWRSKLTEQEFIERFALSLTQPE